MMTRAVTRVARRAAAVALPADDLSGVDNDERLIELWLSNRTPYTLRNYERALAVFRSWRGSPLDLRALTFAEMQDFAAELGTVISKTGRTLEPSSQVQILTAVKALISYGADIGYLRANVGRRLRMPTVAEQTRMLSRDEVLRLIESERDQRNHAILRLLYVCALRVSEAQVATWADLTPRAGAGQITVHGKGSRDRYVLMPSGLWAELEALRDGAATWRPLFQSPHYFADDPQIRGISTRQIERIVAAAAKRVGIAESRVYPHLLRAAHATHAAERRVPMHVIQATLGHRDISTTGRYLRARPTDSSALYLED